MNARLIFVCLALIMSVVSHAQENVAKFFPAAAVPSGGSTNLHNLIKGYITPIAEDYGSLGNSGWYTTAAVHKQWGFDLNLTVTTVSVKSAAETFALPQLSGLIYLGNNQPLQTAYGKEGVYPGFQYSSEDGGNNAGLEFNGADGAEPGKDLPIGSLAIPTLQFGMGVYKGTDLYIRYTPDIKISSVEIGNWGIGVKHDIKQHFGAMSELPFSLSVFAGYTKLKATTDLSGYYTGTGQEGVAQTSSFTLQVLVGKSIKVLSVYAGAGYNTSTTDYDINGTYFVDHTQSGQMLNAPVTLTNPYSDSAKKSGLRATAGLRLKFGPIIINGDYTLVSKTSLLTAGFGFTIR